MIHKLEYESQINCPADKFFAMFKHNILDVPNAMPGSYKSVKVLKGDGTMTVGSIRLWTYVQGDDPTKVFILKEQLEELDDKNRRMTLRVLEGEVMEHYKSLAKTLSVTPTTDGGSLVKWVLEFEKKDDNSPHPHNHLDLLALTSSHFDALLHKSAKVIHKVALEFNKSAKVIHKVAHEFKFKCPADKFFGKFKQDYLGLPNTMPGHYKGIKVIKGDGKSVGSIILVTYVLGDDPNKVLSVKLLLEEFDDENRRITFRVLEGDLMVDYETFAFKFSVTPTSDGGSLVKWVTEFEKKHDHSPHPHSHVDLLAKVSSHFDALLQNIGSAAE